VLVLDLQILLMGVADGLAGESVDLVVDVEIQRHRCLLGEQALTSAGVLGV
jgi:hypothetical protein